MASIVLLFSSAQAFGVAAAASVSESQVSSDDSVDIPNESDDSSMIEAPAAPQAGEGPSSNAACQGEVVRAIVKNQGTKLRKVGVTLFNENTTSRPSKAIFTSEASATVGVAIDAEFGMSAGAVVAKVNNKYKVGASTSVTAKIGVSAHVETPKGYTTEGRFGVKRQQVQFKKYKLNGHCNPINVTYHKTLSPFKAGWVLSERKN